LPMELYARPANRFVAAFIGSPAMNFFEGEIRQSDGKFTFNGSGIAIDVRCDAPPPEQVVLGVRPHHLEVVGDGAGTLRGEVAVVEPMGNEQIVYALFADGKRVVALAPPEPEIRPGSTVSIRVRRDALHFFDATSGSRLSCSGM